MKSEEYKKMLKLHLDWSEVADKITKELSQQYGHDYEDVWAEVCSVSNGQSDEVEFIKDVEAIEDGK